jgi:hypothetical protein
MDIDIEFFIKNPKSFIQKPVPFTKNDLVFYYTHNQFIRI